MKLARSLRSGKTLMAAVPAMLAEIKAESMSYQNKK